VSIAIHDWITGSTVHPAVFDRWPSYRVVLVAGHVDTPALAAIAEGLHAEANESARAADSAETDPHVQLWHAAYRDFGVKPRVARPSVDALLRRAASERGLPRIDVLVDLYNAISVLHRVPIGGEDLDRYEGPARLVIAAGDEPFLTADDGEPVVEHPVEGEPVWTDDQGVTCRRWNWRQTTRTAIHPGTTRVGFIIDSLDGPDHAGATRTAERLAAHVRDPQVRVIDAAHRGTRS
jgi:DNA/RNA-binding domain of Phe-tRNA-synthetase-like protein